jgi:hypothetical protein
MVLVRDDDRVGVQILRFLDQFLQRSLVDVAPSSVQDRHVGASLVDVPERSVGS